LVEQQAVGLNTVLVVDEDWFSRFDT